MSEGSANKGGSASTSGGQGASTATRGGRSESVSAWSSGLMSSFRSLNISEKLKEVKEKGKEVAQLGKEAATKSRSWSTTAVPNPTALLSQTKDKLSRQVSQVGTWNPIDEIKDFGSFIAKDLNNFRGDLAETVSDITEKVYRATEREAKEASGAALFLAKFEETWQKIDSVLEATTVQYSSNAHTLRALIQRWREVKDKYIDYDDELTLLPETMEKLKEVQTAVKAITTGVVELEAELRVAEAAAREKAIRDKEDQFEIEFRARELAHQRKLIKLEEDMKMASDKAQAEVSLVA